MNNYKNPTNGQVTNIYKYLILFIYAANGKSFDTKVYNVRNESYRDHGFKAERERNKSRHTYKATKLSLM